MEHIAISLNQIFGWSIGVSVIVACLISALWSIYFNRIKEGQKAEFQKQIEEQKSEFAKEIENLKAKNENLVKNNFKNKKEELRFFLNINVFLIFQFYVPIL